MLHEPASLRAKNGPPGMHEQDLEAIVAVGGRAGSRRCALASA